jgi:UDP-2-acetamido-2,6-beta-L-arabino-hexul-4-ose reductase
MKILVTGSNGFIGRHLITCLNREPGCQVIGFDLPEGPSELEAKVEQADVVFHLAGVNRPQSTDEFQRGNVDLTSQLCDLLLAMGRPIPLVLSSSIQALIDSPYGASKRAAEEVVSRFAEQSGSAVRIYRLSNVFGRLCRPNYNSVVATFCHNLAHDQAIEISDPSRVVSLVYIDDLAECFRRDVSTLTGPGAQYCEATPTYQVTLGELADLIQSFRRMRRTLLAPDFADPFVRKLYATFLSYVEPRDLAYILDTKCDHRGCLAEFVKSPSVGQIFISRTAPGITRGNHYHDTKTEKFLVVEGEAVIRIRQENSGRLFEFEVSGEVLRVVDIPPGATHSIENVGERELVTLFWASEIFDPQRPDTFVSRVLPESQSQ